jgi:hypothetical protein
VRKGRCILSSTQSPRCRKPASTTIGFATRHSYLYWAAIVDDEAPGLRPLLRYSRTQRGGCIVRLELADGRRLTADGHDMLRDAARRAGCLRAVVAP